MRTKRESTVLTYSNYYCNNNTNCIQRTTCHSNTQIWLTGHIKEVSILPHLPRGKRNNKPPMWFMQIPENNRQPARPFPLSPLFLIVAEMTRVVITLQNASDIIWMLLLLRWIHWPKEPPDFHQSQIVLESWRQHHGSSQGMGNIIRLFQEWRLICE